MSRDPFPAHRGPGAWLKDAACAAAVIPVWSVVYLFSWLGVWGWLIDRPRYPGYGVKTASGLDDRAVMDAAKRGIL